jgi:hypothetical protein
VIPRNDRRATRSQVVRNSPNRQSTIDNRQWAIHRSSMGNRQSVDRQWAIGNPSIVNLQSAIRRSAICNLQSAMVDRLSESTPAAFLR